jgi:phage shock protein A
MGFWSRILLIFKVKGSTVLNEVEDPIEVLNYAGEQQQEFLRRVKQGLIEVAISKRQLQQQMESLQSRIPRLEDQARRAMVSDRQDLARLALERKQAALTGLDKLESQVTEVGAEEERLILAQQQLTARIEDFRTHRKTLSARYSAAAAQVRVNEALGGVTKEFAELGMAVGRAEEKMDRMLVHASAIGALVDSGVLSSPVSNGGDIVERELQAITQRDIVHEEMAELQAEMDASRSLSSSETYERGQ